MNIPNNRSDAWEIITRCRESVALAEQAIQASRKVCMESRRLLQRAARALPSSVRRQAPR